MFCFFLIPQNILVITDIYLSVILIFLLFKNKPPNKNNHTFITEKIKQLTAS